MGDAVNMASRLEGANKVYGTRILATETTIAGTGAAIEVREIDRLVVVGQTHPQVVFEPMAQSGALPPNHATLRTRYAEGLAAYRDRRWDDARSAFNAALEAVPGDGPSTALIRRIDTFAANPLPADWDGSWHLDRK
jgi:adenylate cyclase